MDLDQLKKILDLVREHELAEFEIEQEGLRLKVRKDSAGTLMTLPAAAPANAAPVALPPPAAGPLTTSPAPAAPVPANSEVELAVVKSPIVGTFYRSPEPGTPSFVDIGTTVKKGQVLCIIEAMKLMNEIESEADGRIAEILAQNGQHVEYGQHLFRLAKS